eukprot:snap_masked-scaffold_27-processed-gene-0.28-mRNA-1 protein AED:1.00 eAED:1.00 QI:0/-1/0/0/-1/1/1/0/197
MVYGYYPIVCSACLEMAAEFGFSDASIHVRLLPHVLLDLAFFSQYYYNVMAMILKTYDGSSSSDHLESDGVSLEVILNNKIACEKFEDFLVSKFAGENLAFLNHLREFKKLKGIKMRERAKFMVRRFIRGGSIGEINIKFSVKSAILEDYGAGNITSSMFDDAEDEILRLLTDSMLPKFKKSHYYRSVMMVSFARRV